MSITEQEIVSRIHTLYPDAAVDINGEGCDFEMFVLTNAFADVSALKRQQTLLNLFSEELTSGKIHALSIKAKTYAEMEKANTHLVQIEM